MQIFEKKISLSCDTFATLNMFQHAAKEQICIFDIETTGLSPKVSSLYLIGALWYDNTTQQFHIRQWFADDYISEKQIIESFSEFLQSFTTVVHYNGTGFDLPYIEKKCTDFGLVSPFSHTKSLDIYKEIRPFKHLFDVPNLKLFTAEKRAGFLRKDLLSGKECINTYSQFMQKKFFKDKSRDIYQEKLLLHNEEDLIGTWYCAKLLSYRCPASYLSTEKTESCLHITYETSASFPFPLKWEKDSSFTLFYEKQKIHLTISTYVGELYHFFANYKEYYYLPAEDTAIHKSIGAYVEKEYRQPAKAANCYVKKDGVFLPVPEGISSENRLFFRDTYKSKQHFLLWESETKQDSFLFEEILQILISSVS